MNQALMCVGGIAEWRMRMDEERDRRSERREERSRGLEARQGASFRDMQSLDRRSSDMLHQRIRSTC